MADRLAQFYIIVVVGFVVVVVDACCSLLVLLNLGMTEVYYFVVTLMRIEENIIKPLLCSLMMSLGILSRS